MIDRIDLLRNIGQFDNVSPPAQAALTPFSLLYAENGRGKTTLAAILRSVATGDVELVNDRQRLGSTNTPHIVLNRINGQAVFQNGAWSQSIPEIAIFDDNFVASNVCSGIELNPSHKKNLHELILGAQGVALNASLQTHVDRIEHHNGQLRVLAGMIPALARGPYGVDAFCNIEADANIDEKIQESERRLAAARSAEAIRTRANFQAIVLPDFNFEAIEAVLSQTLEELDAIAAQRVRNHIDTLGQQGENWVAEGVPRISNAPENEDQEICPFCTQDLSDSDIITHYRAYFSDAYKELKETIKNTGISIRDAHTGDIPAAFERNVRTAAQSHEFWKDFAEIPAVDIDTAAIARDWNAARDAVLDQMRAKAMSPLEPMSLSPETREAVDHYRERITQVTRLSEELVACNGRLDVVREQATADDIAALNNDLAKLKAQKARFDPAVVQHCDVYIAEKAAKSATEILRDQTRTALDQYRQQIFPTYEDTINDYLRRFNASFRLAEVQSVNTRAGSSASFCAVINGENVNITADDGPSFHNTLSSGDRNTLALAFFFTSLEQDPNLADKIVVIDDPMTSLDEHRSLCTRQEIIRMAGRVSQIIVLSHSKHFLCSLWEQADRNLTKALRINRAANGSVLDEWDVRNDSITTHDKNYELIMRYLQVADPAIERNVAQALRPVLEAFMRVAFPADFPPGSLLGPFIRNCQQRLGQTNEILSNTDTTELRALLDYANRFHHDSNPAYQTAAINDAELTDYAQRTLLLASRR